MVLRRPAFTSKQWLLGSISGRITWVEAFSGTDELAASCCRVSSVSHIPSPLQFRMLTNRLGLENEAAIRNNFVVKLQPVEHREEPV